MKHSRHISILLLSAILLSLASCGGDAPANDTQTTTEPVSETEAGRGSHGVPDGLDFKGENFHVLHSADFTRYYFAEEANGDTMSDAVYNRRIFVESTLNVTMTDLQVDGAQIHSAVKSSVMADDGAYDYLMTHCIVSTASLVTDGYLYDYADLPYISLNADWWNLDRMEQLQLGKKMCYGVSDLYIPNPYIITVNMDLVDQFKLESPYQMVYDNTWTLDNFIAQCKTVAIDLDGDGQITMNDYSGLSVSDPSFLTSFMHGSNQFLMGTGDDGKAALVIDSEKMYVIVDKMYSLASEPGAVWCNTDANRPNLKSGRTLYSMTSISAIESYRDYELTVGFLPLPKFDEKQEDYMTLDWGGLTCVPATVKNPEMVGAVLELMSWESANGVIPAYYDITLAGKMANNEDCRNMLDLIFDSVVYDPGLNYFGFSSGIDSLMYFLGRTVVQKKSTDFASVYAKNAPAAEKSIASFYEKLESAESAG